MHADWNSFSDFFIYILQKHLQQPYCSFRCHEQMLALPILLICLKSSVVHRSHKQQGFLIQLSDECISKWMAHLCSWTPRPGLQPQWQAWVTKMLMPGTLQTAGPLQAHRTVEAGRHFCQLWMYRDIQNSLQGLQNPPGWDLEQCAVADSALNSCEEAHLNPKECTTKYVFYILQELAVY